MAGFFETRWNGLKNGFNTAVNGVARLFHGVVGYKETPEASPGIVGSVIDVTRAAVDTLFSKDRGIFRFDQGYKLNPWETESAWNPLNYVRKAVAGVLNTTNMIDSRIVGLFSAKLGNFISRWRQGVCGLLLSPIIGDITPYMGPREPTAHNDGDYQAANSGNFETDKNQAA